MPPTFELPSMPGRSVGLGLSELRAGVPHDSLADSLAAASRMSVVKCNVGARWLRESWVPRDAEANVVALNVGVVVAAHR